MGGFPRPSRRLIFAGLIYTLIGLAAVVMTTSRPLMPFFFPVVAGVALLGPVAAVGFYELARRREAARKSTGSTSSTSASARRSTTWAMVAGLLLLIFLGWLLAAACSMRCFRLGDPDLDRRVPLRRV